MSSTDLLLGSKSGQMNLLAVESRADEIRKTLDNLLQTLKFAPASLQWSDAMDKFAVLNIQLQHLSSQLRPLLQHYAVHPRSVNQTNAPMLPIMLATKLLPEQEAEETTLLADVNNDTSSTPAATIEKDVAAVAKATAELAALVDSLTQNGGVLDPKGPARMKITASVRAVDESANKMSSVGIETASQQGSQQHKQVQQPLEGSQLLLAAASYGYSL